MSELQKFQFGRILSHSEMCLVVVSTGSYLKSIISFLIWYIVHSALKLTDIIEVISSDSSFTTFLLIILEFFENLPMIFPFSFFWGLHLEMLKSCLPFWENSLQWKYNSFRGEVQVNEWWTIMWGSIILWIIIWQTWLMQALAAEAINKVPLVES